jgi:hypothetical protein
MKGKQAISSSQNLLSSSSIISILYISMDEKLQISSFFQQSFLLDLSPRLSLFLLYPKTWQNHLVQDRPTRPPSFYTSIAVPFLVLLHVHPLLGNVLVNKSPQRQILGKQSFARLCNNS